MIILKQLSLEGYKSIKQCHDLKLSRLNVMIGANGSGKSNLISFFKLLNYEMSGSLQLFIGRVGGARSLLHYGPKVTPQCSASLQFETESGTNIYHCRLFHAAPDTLIFGEESICYSAKSFVTAAEPRVLGAGHRESALLDPGLAKDKTATFFRKMLPLFRAYQFHDTSEESHLRGRASVDDTRFLYADGGNLASILRLIKENQPDSYKRIVETIRLVAPFFQDFLLEPLRDNTKQVMLRWRATDSDYDFGPHQLSDGTLRFIALTTLLLQPIEQLPKMIIIDEPELGLHPYAVKILASMLAEVSDHAQVFVATQSPTLVDEVSPDDVIVANMEHGASRFERLSSKKLSEWMDDYTLSQLWEKNFVGGRP